MRQAETAILSTSFRYFLAVADSGSIRAAAKELNIASSAVSRQIGALEQILGIQLFDRIGRGLKLSDAGGLLLRNIRAALSGYGDVVTALDALRGLTRGRIKVATVESISVGVLPDLLTAFWQELPDIEIVRHRDGRGSGDAAGPGGPCRYRLHLQSPGHGRAGDRGLRARLQHRCPDGAVSSAGEAQDRVGEGMHGVSHWPCRRAASVCGPRWSGCWLGTPRGSSRASRCNSLRLMATLARAGQLHRLPDLHRNRGRAAAEGAGPGSPERPEGAGQPFRRHVRNGPRPPIRRSLPSSSLRAAIFGRAPLLADLPTQRSVAFLASNRDE